MSDTTATQKIDAAAETVADKVDTAATTTQHAVDKAAKKVDQANDKANAKVKAALDKAGVEEPAKAPTPDEIEDEIIAARARLAHNVDALADEANPATLARKGAERVQSVFVREDGSLRVDNVAKTVGAIVGFVLLRRAVRKGS